MREGAKHSGGQPKRRTCASKLELSNAAELSENELSDQRCGGERELTRGYMCRHMSNGASRAFYETPGSAWDVLLLPKAVACANAPADLLPYGRSHYQLPRSADKLALLC